MAKVNIIHELEYASWGCTKCGGREEDLRLDGYNTYTDGARREKCTECGQEHLLLYGKGTSEKFPLCTGEETEVLKVHPKKGTPFHVV